MRTICFTLNFSRYGEYLTEIQGKTNLDITEYGMCSVIRFVTVDFYCNKLNVRTITNAKSHQENTYIQFPVT
jgi:hypothetical protein